MTTICSVKYHGQTAIAGDGQVTLGKSIIAKTTAKKIRRIYHDQVVIGFAGGVADAVSLQEMLEGKLESYGGDLRRAAVEMAQAWRKDPALQKLEAMVIAFNDKDLLLISGNGEVLEPDESVVAIGSGGYYAQAAAVAMTRHSDGMTLARSPRKPSTLRLISMSSLTTRLLRMKSRNSSMKEKRLVKSLSFWTSISLVKMKPRSWWRLPCTTATAAPNCQKTCKRTSRQRTF